MSRPITTVAPLPTSCLGGGRIQRVAFLRTWIVWDRLRSSEENEAGDNQVPDESEATTTSTTLYGTVGTLAGTPILAPI
jgi:hypothetical protein